LPLTLSVAIPTLGFTGFDSPPRGGPPGPSPRAASSKATRLASPERLPPPACQAPLACAMHRPTCQRLCDRFDPRAQPRIALEPGLHAGSLEACAPQVGSTSSMVFLAEPMQTELRRVRTRSAFAAQEPESPWRPVKDAWVAGHYPDPSQLGHLLSCARRCAGWRDQHLRVLAHPFRAHQGN